MKVANMDSELSYRRFKWSQDIINFPSDNGQVRAAVFGTLQDGLEPEEFNPWVEQWVL